MRVAESAQAMTQHPDAESNLVVISGVVEQSERFFGGVFQGIGPAGAVVAHQLAVKITEAAVSPPTSKKSAPSTGARRMASVTEKLLKTAHRDVRQQGIDSMSGATANVAFFKKKTLTVVNIGNGWAAFYSDKEPLEGAKPNGRLLTPHDSAQHKKDRIRLSEWDKIKLDQDGHFGGQAILSRAIGLHGLPHVIHHPEIAERKNLVHPGILILGSGGNWGSAPGDDEAISEAAKSHRTDMAGLVEELTAVASERTGANVAAVALRIIPES